VLRDSNNVKYKIHKYITRTSSSQKQPHAVWKETVSHVTYESDILLEAARSENKKLTTAAAM
jgi:hypothetical protein